MGEKINAAVAAREAMSKHRKPAVNRTEISQIIVDALGGEEARITIEHPENAGETTTTGTAREVGDNLADWLLNAGLK